MLSRAQSDEMAGNNLIGVRLEPFVDRLFVPPLLRASSARPNAPTLKLVISEFRQRVHRDLPPTVMWGFNGMSPGPTIETECNRALTVYWQNRLPERHRLSVDGSLDGAGAEIPEVRTVVHLHGGHVSAADDGYPEDWIVPGQQQRTFYPNAQRAATLWYHDHAMGITRLNAMMGLAGVYLVRDPDEKRLGLPSGHRDIPLILQDRIFDPRGQIAYPVSPLSKAPWMPEFFGTSILVNGRVSPYLDVEPRLYRFRVLNASNARIYQLSLSPEQRLFQIASDGGLLAQPVSISELSLAPGERAELLVDFRGREGRRMNLVNHAPAPFPTGGAPVPGLVMQFRINRPSIESANEDTIPDRLADVPRLEEAVAAKTRRLTLVEVMSMDGQPHRMLLDGKRFMDPVTEDPVHKTTEIWEFVNPTIDAHPIHLHAVHFQLLDRQPFDLLRYQRTSEVVLLSRASEGAREERGWKDTVLCPPGQVTRIIVPFRGEPGKYVWHCHTLEHEDNEMMRPYLLRA